MSLPTTDWENLDWAALERLRETFLTGTGAAGTYWQSPADLANYDLTFAQRIAWKWDAVLAELKLRGWTPPAGSVLDWGCGSGVAGRCVLHAFGPANFTALHVFDRSSLAMDFATARAQARFPQLTVSCGAPPDGPIGLLVLSHVLNELPATDRDALLALARRAAAVLWVEPGTHADSRALIAAREELLGEFEVIAPCTHAAACGLLTPLNGHHWCHGFAPPPPGVLTDSDWVRFGQRMGIDLRSVPYSFLVLERRGLRAEHGQNFADWSRVVDPPRVYKGFARLLCCDASGARDRVLQKRDAPEIFKRLRHDEPPLLIRGEVAEGERLTTVTGTLP